MLHSAVFGAAALNGAAFIDRTPRVYRWLQIDRALAEEAAAAAAAAGLLAEPTPPPPPAGAGGGRHVAAHWQWLECK